MHALREHLEIEIKKVIGDPGACLGIDTRALVAPCSDRIEVHPKLLTPLLDVDYADIQKVHEMDFMLRPPTPRRSQHDKLLVSYSFTVRTGINVTVREFRDDSLLEDGVKVVVKMDPGTYKKPDDPPSEPVTVLLDDLLAAIPEQKQLVLDFLKAKDDELRSYGYSWAADRLKEKIQKIFMDVYHAPIAGSLIDDTSVMIDIPVEDLLQSGSGMVIDDTQPFPIYGWMRLRWR